ncbi:MAG: hypothetical protein AB1749_15125 [Pseudomonadota bacterium]
MPAAQALSVAAMLASLSLAAATATAAPRAWDKSANIVVSAERLAAMQRGKGAIATYEFILNCYKTHRLAEAFSEPLEGCIVQDYLNSKVTAAVYDRVDAETRKRLGAPSPEQLMKVMSARIIDACRQYGIGEEQIRAFLQKVDAEGLPRYLAKRFPGAGGQPGADKPPDAAAPPR